MGRMWKAVTADYSKTKIKGPKKKCDMALYRRKLSSQKKKIF
jgi:hypothetical protein